MGMRILFTVALASSAVVFAQNAQRGTQRGSAGGTASSKPFDPHDLSGFWDITSIGLPRGALNETSNNRPPMTPWGLEKFRKTKTGDANALTNGTHPNQKDWNDPIRWCDPTGFPRIMWNPTPAGMRLAQTDEEVIQFFQNNRVWRDIWTDGRNLPDADADSRWYGYSVGRWEGDTFVVNSNNFTDTSWLDQYGSPHSDQMTVEERYRRVDHDTIEFNLTIDDPKTYTKTWYAEPRTIKLKPGVEIPESFCVASEEEEFAKRIREPAARQIGKE